MNARLSSSRPRGIALAIVLMTLLLATMISVAVALTAKTGAMTEQKVSDRAMALMLVHQAANLKVAFHQALDRGTAASSITLGTTGATDLYAPSGVGLPVQTPPRNALTVTDANVPNYTWTLQVDASGNPEVKLNGVGTSAAEYIVAVGPLTQEVCNQIDLIIYGQETSPGGNAADGTLANWMTRPSSTLIDMSGDSGMTQPEQCIGTSDNYGVYYVTLQSG